MNIKMDTSNIILAIAGSPSGPASTTTRSPAFFENQPLADALAAYLSQDAPELLDQPCGTLSGIETVDGEEVLVLRYCNRALMAFQILPGGQLGEQADAPVDEDSEGEDLDDPGPEDSEGEGLDDPGPEDDDMDDFGGEPEDEGEGVGEDHAAQ